MLQTILTGTNHGGIQSVYAFPKSDILLYSESKGHTAITILSEANAIELLCIRDSVKFLEKKDTARQGDKYTVTVTGIMAGDKEANREIYASLDSGEWLVITLDNNGQCRLCGDNDSPMQFNRDSNSDDGFTKRNSQQFEFSTIMSHSCAYIPIPAF